MGRAAILALVAAQAAAHERGTRGEVTPAAIAAAQGYVKKLLTRADAYHAYAVRNGQAEGLLIAWRQKDDADRDTIFVHPWLVEEDDLTDGSVERELGKVRRFFGKRRRPLSVALFPGQERLRGALERLGFRPDAMELIGKVRDGLTATSRRLKALDHRDYQVRPMTYSRDIKRVVALELMAHGAEPSSRVHHLRGMTAERRLRKFYRSATTGKNRVLLLEHKDGGGALAGVVGVTFHDRREDTAILGSICVHPDHQGRGLAHRLYHEAFTVMAAGRARFYLGYTTTGKVLTHAAGLKRKVRLTFLDDAKAHP